MSGSGKLLLDQVLEVLELHADVAHSSEPMKEARERVERKMCDPVDPPEGVRWWEELESAVQAAVRRAQALRTVRENQRVPWPVPEELERPGWEIQEVFTSSRTVKLGHVSSVAADRRSEEDPVETEIEEEIVGQWLHLDVEIFGGKRRVLRFGWSVRLRRIFVWVWR